MEKDILYMGVKCFNRLPADLREEKNCKIFLKHVKDRLVNKSYYTIEEYLLEGLP